MTMRMSAPIEEHTSRRGSVGDSVRGWIRLFAIEMRRTPAIYAALLIAVTTAWLIWDQLPVGIVRWREISDFASHAMLPSSAIAAGIAAFLAGRDERLQLEDQFAQTSLGSPKRDILAFSASLTWCLLAYLAVVGGFFVYAARHATWGGPAWGLVALTAVTIALGLSLGWLIGVVFRSRFSPLVAFAIMIGLNALYQLTVELRRTEIRNPDGGMTFTHRESGIKFLAPYELLDFHDLLSFMAPGFVWIIGLTVILTSVAWWWRHRTVTALVSLAVAAMVSGIAAANLVSKDPNMGPAYRRASAMYVAPVCESRLDGHITVCLHPEDMVLMEDVAGTVERLIVPLVGISGVPMRFENQTQQQDPETIYLYVYDAQDLEFHVTSTVLRELMTDPAGQWMIQTGSAQYVFLAWLLQEAGISRQDAMEAHYLRPLPLVQRTDEAIAAGITDPMEINRFMETNQSPDDIGAFEAEIDDAIGRFVAMPDDERRAWLEANWDALRANELTLEDLP